MELKDLKKFNDLLDNLHTSNKKNSGYEINDRNIFINYILKPLGYSHKNILQDVPQKGEKGSKAADIRLFGKNEYKSKHSYSQFIIESKNYKMFSLNNYEIDYLQLKRYIKFNESKIRLIGLTDYQKFFLFNATEIKKNSIINLNNLNSITNSEIEIFQQNRFMNIDLDNLTESTINKLSILSHERIFENQKFINPQDYEMTNSINDPLVRKNFIMELYHLMIKLQDQIVPNFETKILDIQSLISLREVTRNKFLKLITDQNNLPVRNFFIWGIEMNYLDDFINEKESYDIDSINEFLNDREKKDAFVLTSIYNIINKTMFLRILEDSSTKSTQFIQGIVNGRYISNGILEQKRKEGNGALLRHFINVFKFEQNDLKPYKFILSKDIYNWILNEEEFMITNLLVELIRVFNDVNFNKINQDILGDIYEHYLDQEEKESGKTSRRLLGQYYTPKPIVRLMWYLTRDVLQEQHGRDLYSKDEDFLSIIDPACGSGTFISESILQINESASNKRITRDGKVFSFIKDRTENKKIEDNIYGFELNPLSKSIADINLFFGLIQAYGGYTTEEIIDNINIYRTNSFKLSENNSEGEIEDVEDKVLFLQSELKKSYLQKYYLNKAKSQKYNIVIGNPPYGVTEVNETLRQKIMPFAFAENNFNTNGDNVKFDWNMEKFIGKVPKNEKNVGKLNDLYGYFFGIADILCEDDGIVSYITANTYLTIPSYKWFRKYILENYTIEYIINFNNISEKGNSIFYPDAGVGTCIIIMRKVPAKPNHQIKYLDLKDIDNIKEKFEAFSEVNWGERSSGKVNKNDIKRFLIKPIKNIQFKKTLQSNFFNNTGYVFSLHDDTEIELLNKIEDISVPITTYSNKNLGVDVGDLRLVQKSKEEVKEVIERIVFQKNLTGLNNTLKNHLTQQFKKGNINAEFDENKIEKFVNQKHLKPYSYTELSYTYLDKNLLWRSRIDSNLKLDSIPISSKYKLLIREERSKGNIMSVVTEETILPQHGGRLMYLVPDDDFKLDDMYLMSAIINSKVLQYFYKNRSIGNKDILIPKLGEITNTLKQELVELSKKLHSLELEKYHYINGHKEMTMEDDSLIKASLFNDNNYWNLDIEDSLAQNYNVNEIILEESKITLNDNFHLEAGEGINIKQLYKQIENYRGNLIDKPLIINVLKLIDEEEDYLSNIAMDIKSLKDKVNIAVYKIFNLNNDEREKINSLTDF